ncbi:MAG TPA: methyltransferase [Acidimicrobiia bacterium]|nr:methyltransferase [Acidimicrobiia bacterium]
MRDFLGLGRRKLAPPFIVTLEHLQGMIDNKALVVAVELEIPDRLHEGSRSAEELAREVGADADALNRLLRFLVSRGLLGITRDGRYRNNVVSSALRRDHPWSARNWVLFFGGDWHWRIWNQAKHSFLTGESAAEAATGHEFFEYVNEVDSTAGEAFNGAMTEGSRLQGLLVVNAYDFSRVASVCDVGGGSGAIMCDLLAAHPALRGVVFDLPQLGEPARALLAARGVGDRGEFVAGDFFAEVPAGHDVYTLFAIVHDWGDDHCITILRNIRRAMTPGAHVLVTEMPVPERPSPSFAKVMDLEMLILTGSGRERTAAEYRALFGRGGFAVVREIPLPSLFTVFELAPA